MNSLIATGRAMNQRPVFVFATHRSGSTLLERMLNCHPNLVLWGEHGGVFNQLAELAAVAALFKPLNRPLTERNLSSFVRHKNVATFNPWRNPVSVEDLHSFIRDWMLQTFCIGVTPEQRWGVKEIRYGGEAITKFLMTLFPECQFIILRRNLIDLCVSNIMAAWSLGGLRAQSSFEDEADAEAVVADCAYAVTAMDLRLQASAATAGAAAMSLDIASVPNASADVFDFLQLPLKPALQKSVAKVLETRVGDTNKDITLGKLNHASIRFWAEKHVALSLQDISQNGFDRARLLGQDGKGRYSFLIGDHALLGTGKSSMGWTL